MTSLTAVIARRCAAVLLASWLAAAGGLAVGADGSGPVGAAAGAVPPPGLLPQSSGDGPPTAAQRGIPPRNTGPAARAHSRYRRGRHATTRVIRRTPEVMREDAVRVRRGDLFSTWSNEYLE
ncbi:MAG: hypothetical protein RLZZ111_406 [Planctomycetota bacterium]|jgi:hypothetical protein